MKDELVSFEIAKLAKEKGFEGICRSYYYIGNPYGPGSKELPFENEDDEERSQSESIILRPTQSLLQTWLRRKHEIHITIKIWRDMDHLDNYSFVISKPSYIKPLWNKKLKGLDIMDRSPESRPFDEYEKALEVALQEALKLI